jgi:hypothetical protein
MRFPYVIDASRRLAVVTISGTVRREDIAETIQALYRDPLWQRGLDALWDGRGITELLFEPDDVGSFATLQLEFADVARDGRDVFLMVRILDYVTASFYQFLAARGPRPAHVCRSEAEAHAILEERRERRSN